MSGPEEELRAASREVGCHALTLDLLGHYLVAAHHGDVRRRGLISLDTADARLSGRQVFGVMRAYKVWFGSSEGDGPRQLAALRLIGLFDRPADEQCLTALRSEPKIDGLCDALAVIISDEWSIAVSNLESVHLVRRVVEDAAPISGFDFAEAEGARREGILGVPRHWSPARTITALEAHPLVREYFANRLRSENPEAFRAGHERIYRLLARSVPYWPEGIEGLAPLYQAVVHGCLAGFPTDACANVYRDRIERSRYGSGYSFSVLGGVASDLAVLKWFFADPWSVPHPSLPVPAQAWVLRDAAFNLEAAGRLSEALDPLRKSVRQTVAAGTSHEAASRCNDLSRARLLRDRSALERAAKRIERWQYGRRRVELNDARAFCRAARVSSGDSPQVAQRVRVALSGSISNALRTAATTCSTFWHLCWRFRWARHSGWIRSAVS